MGPPPIVKRVYGSCLSLHSLHEELTCNQGLGGISPNDAYHLTVDEGTLSGT